jgi:antitoxin FitA
MAPLIVRLSDDLQEKLRERARRHGRSAEAEVRDILCGAVRREDVASQPLGTRIRSRFARIGLDCDIPEFRS